ncbi:hypothetical protein HDV05_007581 [Chytridiales sp. JEL 0842]|nr:hypothetical protein HDV05_007581 [Chytridiales sp. JEL 0842]
MEVERTTPVSVELNAELHEHDVSQRFKGLGVKVAQPTISTDTTDEAFIANVPPSAEANQGAAATETENIKNVNDSAGPSTDDVSAFETVEAASVLEPALKVNSEGVADISNVDADVLAVAPTPLDAALDLAGDAVKAAVDAAVADSPVKQANESELQAETVTPMDSAVERAVAVAKSGVEEKALVAEVAVHTVEQHDDSEPKAETGAPLDAAVEDKAPIADAPISTLKQGEDFNLVLDSGLETTIEAVSNTVMTDAESALDVVTPVEAMLKQAVEEETPVVEVTALKAASPTEPVMDFISESITNITPDASSIEAAIGEHEQLTVDAPAEPMTDLVAFELKEEVPVANVRVKLEADSTFTKAAILDDTTAVDAASESVVADAERLEPVEGQAAEETAETYQETVDEHLKMSYLIEKETLKVQQQKQAEEGASAPSVIEEIVEAEIIKRDEVHATVDAASEPVVADAERLGPVEDQAAEETAETYQKTIDEHLRMSYLIEEETLKVQQQKQVEEEVSAPNVIREVVEAETIKRDEVNANLVVEATIETAATDDVQPTPSSKVVEEEANLASSVEAEAHLAKNVEPASMEGSEAAERIVDKVESYPSEDLKPAPSEGTDADGLPVAEVETDLAQDAKPEPVEPIDAEVEADLAEDVKPANSETAEVVEPTVATDLAEDAKPEPVEPIDAEVEADLAEDVKPANSETAEVVEPTTAEVVEPTVATDLAEDAKPEPVEPIDAEVEADLAEDVNPANSKTAEVVEPTVATDLAEDAKPEPVEPIDAEVEADLAEDVKPANSETAEVVEPAVATDLADDVEPVLEKPVSVPDVTDVELAAKIAAPIVANFLTDNVEPSDLENSVPVLEVALKATPEVIPAPAEATVEEPAEELASSAKGLDIAAGSEATLNEATLDQATFGEAEAKATIELAKPVEEEFVNLVEGQPLDIEPICERGHDRVIEDTTDSTALASQTTEATESNDVVKTATLVATEGSTDSKFQSLSNEVDAEEDIEDAIKANLKRESAEIGYESGDEINTDDEEFEARERQAPIKDQDLEEYDLVTDVEGNEDVEAADEEEDAEALEEEEEEDEGSVEENEEEEPSLTGDPVLDAALKPRTGKPSLFEEVWLSIFEPGVTSGVVRVMDYAFYGLFASLALLLVATQGNFHVVFLSVVSICLFASVKWFLAEMKKVDAAKEAEKEAKAPLVETNENETSSTVTAAEKKLQ